MRIGTGVQLPPPTPPPSSLPPAASALDRALLLRVAALADDILRPIFDLQTERVGSATAPAVREALVIAAALKVLVLDADTALPKAATSATLPAQALSALLGARSLLTGASTALPSPLPLGLAPGLAAGLVQAASGLTNAANLAAAIRASDRLSLSPTVTALRLDPAGSARSPTIELALDLLTALTGEARSRIQWLGHGADLSAAGGYADPLSAASQVGKPAAEVLQLLVRGSLRSADAKLIDLTLGLTVQRQAGTATLDDATLASIRNTLEQLAQGGISLDFPGAASALAGHSARFQAMLDPIGLWPMQSFLLSGLLLFGTARELEPADELEELDDTEGDASGIDPDDEHADAQSRDDQAPRDRRPRADASAMAEPITLPPDDGGPPVISASAWLELEMRHWRSQLRLWMALPALPAPSGLAPPTRDSFKRRA